jgi:NADPH-dependent 2,4-dienoyl-CoA reductase/sulfur reductase-like enzyme
MKHLIKKIVIVGGRAAGPAAAAKASRENPEAEITMIEAGRYISTGTCEIPYLISNEVSSAKELVFGSLESFLSHYNTKVLLQTEVISINRRVRKIELKKGEVNFSLDYDRLILTTGSNHRIDPLFSPAFKNVFYVKNIEEIERLLESGSINGKKWCVIGASFAGIEFADALNRAGNKVIMLDREVLPGKSFAFEIRQLIKETLTQNGIEFFHTPVDPQIILDGNKIVKIKIEGYLKEIDNLIVAIGVVPNSELAKKAGIEIGSLGGIRVDNRMKTSDPYIFAAGDCTEIKEKVTGRHVFLPQATIARDGGHVAGANAAGGNEFMYPVIKNVALRVCDKFATRTGVCETTLKSLNIPYKIVMATTDALVKVMPGSQKVLGKLLIASDGKLLGAGFFGGTEVSGYADIIALAIKSGIRIQDLKHNCFNYTPTLSPFKNIIELLAHKASRL